ncbi:MAG: immunoglobulin domain-containing protein [Phycisphaerales bacterium]
MRTTLFSLSATLLLSASAGAQQFQYLTQTRSIKAQSVAMPQQTATAANFNPFNASVSSVGTPEAQSNGNASASQISTLGVAQFTSSGYADPGKSNAFFSGYGTASSTVLVTLNVQLNTSVNLVTNFSNGSVSLTGPGISFVHGSTGSSNESGVMLAGQTYTLSASTTGSIQFGNAIPGSFSFTLKVSGFPAVPLDPQSSATSPVCPGTGVTVSVADPGTGMAIDWYTNGDLIGTGTSLVVYPTVGPNQIYYARTRRISDGIVSLQLASVSVPVKYALAPTAASTSRDNLCQYDGGTIQLTASGGVGTDYQWFAGACASTPIGSGTSITIPAPHVTTTYYVRKINDCAASDCFTRVVQVRMCPGDFSCDGVVADDDFVSFTSSYDILVCSDPSMPMGCPADLNLDGFVDDIDFTLFAMAYDALECP